MILQLMLQINEETTCDDDTVYHICVLIRGSMWLTKVNAAILYLAAAVYLMWGSRIPFGE